MSKGILITFEGIEGSGKTTQIKILEEFLTKRGRGVLATREPGGTKISDQIRKLLLNPLHKELTPLAELFLYEAARAQHVREIILPALDEGKIVLCDRFCDATTAYQGGAREISPALVQTLNQIASENIVPRLTLLLDCPVEIGLKRARDRYQMKEGAEKGDRLEQEEILFHEKVREAYLTIASNEPNRVVVVDGTEDIDHIQQTIIKEIERIL